MSKLDEIVARRRADLALPGARLPAAEIDRRAAAAPPVRPFRAALGGLAVIAEVKRRSPSEGQLAEAADPVAIARAYEAAGAAALSVLTEPHYFGGSLDDLTAVRQAVGLPVLRKDFTVDPYQIAEARTAGADAVLLIVAALGRGIAPLLAAAADWGLAALVEVHDAAEVAIAIEAGAQLIGINNRNLADLSIDLATTERLRPLVPPGITVVAESGISTSADLDRMAAAGGDAVLIGSALMRTSDPGAALRALTAGRRRAVA